MFSINRVMADQESHRFVLGLEIYETYRTMRRHFDRRARALGFTQVQWRALLRLGSNPGISQARLADLLDMQPISLARILDRLAAANLVERRPDPVDRRVVQLYLTPAAAPILKVLHEISDDLRATATKGLSSEGQAQVVAFLSQMRINLVTLDADTSTPTTPRAVNL